MNTEDVVLSNDMDYLECGLRGFIKQELRKSVGDDFFDAFVPSESASVVALLDFIISKWLGVFADSRLSHSKDLLLELRTLCLQRNRVVFSDRRKSDDNVLSEKVEQVLIAIGNRSLAAKYGAFLRQKRAEQPVNPRVSQISNGSSTTTSQGGSAVVRKEKIAASDDYAPMVDVDSDCLPSSMPAPSNKNDKRHNPNDQVPVVLDGSNIAWRHGNNKRFSVYGAAEALAYFSQRGFPTALILPEARLTQPLVDEKDRRPYEALKSIQGTEMLILTPDADYDDAYIVNLARRCRGVVVSNDRFVDQVYQAEAQGQEAANQWRKWLASCRVSFTFQGDIFIPNPAFDFVRARKVANELALIPD